MARFYSVPMQAFALATSKVDLWAVTAGSALELWIEEVVLDPFDTSVAFWNLSFHLFTAAFTAGIGGTIVTPTTHDPTDAAAAATAKIGNTTQTTGGTNVVKRAAGPNLVNGFLWQPQKDQHRYKVPVSGCFVVSLDTVPASPTLNGNLIFSEGA